MTVWVPLVVREVVSSWAATGADSASTSRATRAIATGVWRARNAAATVAGTRIVLLKTVPFSPAGVCLRPRPVPHAGTERATRDDAAASDTIWKVRTTVGGRLPGGSFGPWAGGLGDRGVTGR